jgi:hypothetical protein
MSSTTADFTVMPTVTPTFSVHVEQFYKHVHDLLTPTTTPTEWMKKIQTSLYASRDDPIFMNMRSLHLVHNITLEISHYKHTIVLVTPAPYGPQTQAGICPRPNGYVISCEPTTNGRKKKTSYHITWRTIEHYKSLLDTSKDPRPNALQIKERDNEKHTECSTDTDTNTYTAGADLGGATPESTSTDGVLLVIDLNSILHYAEACIPLTGDSRLTHVSEYRELIELAHPTLLPPVSRLLYQSTDKAMLRLTPPMFVKLHTRVCSSLQIKPDIAWTITSNVDMETLTTSMNLHECRRAADVLIWTRDDAFYRRVDRTLSAYFTTKRLVNIERNTSVSPRELTVINRLLCLPSKRSSYSCVFVRVCVTHLTQDVAHRTIEALSIMCRLHGIRCSVGKESSVPPFSMYQSLEHPGIMVSPSWVVGGTGPCNYVFGANQMVLLDPTKSTASIFRDIVQTAITPIEPPRDMRLTPVIKTHGKCNDGVFTIFPVDNIITTSRLFLCTQTASACTSFKLNARVKVFSTNQILLYEWHYNHDLVDVPPDYYFVAYSPPGMERMFELLWVCMKDKIRSPGKEQNTFEAQLRYDVQSVVTQPVMIFSAPMHDTHLQLSTDAHYALCGLPTLSPPVVVPDLAFRLL